MILKDSIQNISENQRMQEYFVQEIFKFETLKSEKSHQKISKNFN